MPTIIRKNDPKWAIHSTNREAWESILQDGCLKSLSILKKENKAVKSVGFHQLGEPIEYAEYIILGRIDTVNAEHVVASQQKGYVFTEENTSYKPGVRLYFDNHKIIERNLGVRDGLHSIKVHNKLPLNPFFITAITINDIDSENKIIEWTPSSFYQAANKEFYKRMNFKMEEMSSEI